MWLKYMYTILICMHDLKLPPDCTVTWPTKIILHDCHMIPYQFSPLLPLLPLFPYYHPGQRSLTWLPGWAYHSYQPSIHYGCGGGSLYGILSIQSSRTAPWEGYWWTWSIHEPLFSTELLPQQISCTAGSPKHHELYWIPSVLQMPTPMVGIGYRKKQWRSLTEVTPLKDNWGND